MAAFFQAAYWHLAVPLKTGEIVLGCDSREECGAVNMLNLHPL